MRSAAEPVIDVHELTAAEVERVDAVLPLSRLDAVQTYLVAWREAEPVGHAHIAWTGTTLDAPEIQDVFVRPDFRRRRVAAEIAHSAERLARSRGYSTITLSYGKSNESARHLYEGPGYERAPIPPQRIRERIWIRGVPLDVDETMIYLVKRLDGDPEPPDASY